MKFTYDAYSNLLRLLHEKGYVFTDFLRFQEGASGGEGGIFSPARCVILRHDIDCSLDDAIPISEIEKNEDVPSSWFVLLKTDFYNPLTTENIKKLRTLQKNGGIIGLHFDESQYTSILRPLLSEGAETEYQECLYMLIRKEIEFLSLLLDTEIKAVSMHCPSPEFIKRHMKFPGIVNTYEKTFFQGFKYLSDSCMHWREDVTQIVSDATYSRLQILTHAFWYSEKEDGRNDRLRRFCQSACTERYSYFKNYYGEF